jgi:hypothetical protein
LKGGRDVVNESDKREHFLSLMEKALKEMKGNQVVLFKRGDLFREDDRHLYKSMYEEIRDVKDFIKDGASIDKGYRHLQMNVFMKNESFLMNLFETKNFPDLFELFEFE